MSASARKSKQPPVRAILRALNVLVELNNLQSVTSAELARAVGLPRPTVHRILETLVTAGYVTRDDRDQRYRPDASVARLSTGYPEEDWLRRFAVGPMQALAADTGREVAIATQSDLSMLVRVLIVDDDGSARLGLDGSARMLTSASGILCLTFAEPGYRDILLRKLAWSEHPLDAQALNGTAVSRLIDLIAGRGYAVSYRSVDSEFSQALAVPVLPHGRFLAALILRTGNQKMNHERVVHEYLHALQRGADLIREGFERRPVELEGSVHLLRPADDA